MSLTEDQQIVVNKPNKSKLVLALPGSGKTHTSIQLAANILNESDNNWLIMVTFTRASTNETSERIAKVVDSQAMNRCRVDTFAKLMKDHGQPIARGKRVIYGPQHEMLIRRAASNFAGERKIKAAEYLRTTFAMDYLKHEGQVESMRPAAQAYYRTLQQSRKIDQSTLSVELVLALRRGDIQPFGATHIIVDEFQDTDMIQYEWILAHREQGTVTTVVADDDQSIYSWRGARGFENMKRFQSDFEAEGILLRKCFRCRPEILKVAESLIGNNFERVDKEMISVKPAGGKVEFLGITQGDIYESDGFDPDELREEFIKVCEFAPTLDKYEGRKRRVLENAHNEYVKRIEKYGKRSVNINTFKIYTNTHGYIAKQIGKDPSGWAVLARTNRVLDSIQLELAELGVDVKRIGGKSMWDNPNIMGYVAVLAVLARDNRINELDDALFFLREGADAISEVHEKAREAKALRHVASFSIEAPVRGGLEFMLESIQPAQAGTEAQDIKRFLSESMNKICSLDEDLEEKRHILKMVNDILLSYSGTFTERVDRLLSFTRQKGKNESGTPKDVVTLCTLNGSKGLQWPKVWLMDVENNVLPIKPQTELPPGQEEAHIEEERRLAYVGITRAEELLKVTWADGKDSIFIQEARGY